MNKRSNFSFLFFVSLVFSGISWATVNEDFEDLEQTLLFSRESADIQVFVTEAPDILTEKNPEGKTALYMAAELGHPVATQYFINRGLDVNARDRFGITPLTAVLRKAQYLALRVTSELPLERERQEYAHVVNLLIRNGSVVSNEDARLLLELYFPMYGLHQVREREEPEDDDELGPRVKRRRLHETELE